MSASNPRELEEERRLFYVAVTRAEKQVTLSYALNRYKWGNLERCQPSRFLSEIDQRFITYPQTGGKPFPKARMEEGRKYVREEPEQYTKTERLKPVTRAVPRQETNVPFEPVDPSSFTKGDSVQHERFGNGVIVSIEGNAPNTTATVDFGPEGKKKLLLRFAKLRKV
jgi:DNA helicase-2/ATP-dependent DNA helicase PcrA